jgi:hypothetical protein
MIRMRAEVLAHELTINDLRCGTLAWLALEHYHATGADNRDVELHHRIGAKKMKPRTELSAHWEEMEALRHLMVQAGADYGDVWFKNAIIDSLSVDFAPGLVDILGRGKVGSLSTLRNQLMTYELYSLKKPNRHNERVYLSASQPFAPTWNSNRGNQQAQQDARAQRTEDTRWRGDSGGRGGRGGDRNDRGGDRNDRGDQPSRTSPLPAGELHARRMAGLCIKCGRGGHLARECTIVGYDTTRTIRSTARAMHATGHDTSGVEESKGDEQDNEQDFGDGDWEGVSFHAMTDFEEPQTKKGAQQEKGKSAHAPCLFIFDNNDILNATIDDEVKDSDVSITEKDRQGRISGATAERGPKTAANDERKRGTRAATDDDDRKRGTKVATIRISGAASNNEAANLTSGSRGVTGIDNSMEPSAIIIDLSKFITRPVKRVLLDSIKPETGKDPGTRSSTHSGTNEGINRVEEPPGHKISGDGSREESPGCKISGGGNHGGSVTGTPGSGTGIQTVKKRQKEMRKRKRKKFGTL